MFDPKKERWDVSAQKFVRQLQLQPERHIQSSHEHKEGGTFVQMCTGCLRVKDLTSKSHHLSINYWLALSLNAVQIYS